MLVLLMSAPAALASTASLRAGTTVVYQGDPAGDTVTLSRFVDEDRFYYLVTDSDGITPGSGCFRVRVRGNNTDTVACEVTAGLKRYEIATGGGDDRVGFDAVGSGTTPGATTGGIADLGPGTDRFTGLASGSSADTVDGGDGADTIEGGAGNDAAVGGAGNDQVAGQAGNDAVDGGPGDDSIEFGGPGVPAGAGVGADDLRGGGGVDLLSYNDHGSGITVTIDEQPGDGSAGEGDNVHSDVETVIGTTLSDTLTGDGAGQDLYGHGGNDTIDGGGGDDLVNGGTGEDVVRGGAGNDGVQGSAGGDLLDGGSGSDLFAGDNECTTAPCTGGSDTIQARDGELDTVNCGVGADRATVDAIDIVAVDSQQGCESVDRAALPLAAAGTPPAITPAPTMRVRGARRLRTLLRRGLRVDVTCPAACSIRARLVFRKAVVAAARRTRITGGLTRLRLKANRAGRRRLKGRPKARVTLVIDVTDSAGTKTTLARPITLTRRKAAARKPG